MEIEFLENNTPSLECLEMPRKTTSKLLPQKSQLRYEIIYNNFMSWLTCKHTNKIKENIMLANFMKKEKELKSPTLRTYCLVQWYIWIKT